MKKHYVSRLTKKDALAILAIGPNGSKISTRVGKANKAAYVESLTRAAVAAFKASPDSIWLHDYMPWNHIRILIEEAQKHGMEPGPYLIHMIEVGRKAYEAAHAA